jgi:hypothetical protein
MPKQYSMNLLYEFSILLNFKYLGPIIEAAGFEKFRNQISQILEITWKEKMQPGQKTPIVFNNSSLSKLR